MTHTNRLIHETSPYLRQHAHNPVDWYPWGQEALERARNQDKPIFLSVGYSACHWCHVMERESFENEEIAKIMNEHFVCIKVDREERPDIDQIYMNVVQLITHHGGWPMSVFLSPDQKPLFAGTYFPPEDRMGMPGFARVLTEISRLYRENPPELAKQTQGVMDALQSLSKETGGECSFRHADLEIVAKNLLNHIDPQNGGFGHAPKFPQTMALSFLLRSYQRSIERGGREEGQSQLLKAVTNTLEKMAKGGIYDQLAGGFSRYSVDEKWAVPHFEKMLYDNALLAALYFEVFQVSQNPYFKKVGMGILDYVMREMVAPEGGFYSSQDADSESQEGKFYVWDPQEFKTVLGEKDGSWMCRYFGVDETGNFENGKTVLFINEKIENLAKQLHLSPEEIHKQIEINIQKLLKVRQNRIAPDRDDKILTSWNALMIRAFVKGYQVTAKRIYLETAQKAAQYLLQNLVDKKDRTGEWRLFVTAKGDQAKYNAYLDEYAFLSAALLDLFEVSGDPQWLNPTIKLNQVVLERFRDPQAAGFYFTADDHEQLIDRPKNFHDTSIPSGFAYVLENLLRLQIITGNHSYREIVKLNLKAFMKLALERPMAMPQLLHVADRFLGPEKEIVLVKGSNKEEYQHFLQALWQCYLPRSFVCLKFKNDLPLHDEIFKGLAEIYRGKTAHEERTTLYVCQGQSCSRPITRIDEMKEII